VEQFDAWRSRNADVPGKLLTLTDTAALGRLWWQEFSPVE
jgi:hypothetical protein